MKYLKLICVIVFISLQSCDYVFRTGIVNSSNNNIILTIEFDKNYCESNGSPDFDYLRRKVEFNEGDIINFDTINLISNISLKPEEYFEIESGVGSFPDFNIYKKIVIISNDTLILDSKDKMTKAFKAIEIREYLLEIE